MKTDSLKTLLRQAAPQPRLSDPDAFWARVRQTGASPMAEEDAARIARALREAAPAPRLTPPDLFWRNVRRRIRAERLAARRTRLRKAIATLPGVAAGLAACLAGMFLLGPAPASAGPAWGPSIETYEINAGDVLGASVLFDEDTASVVLWILDDESAETTAETGTEEAPEAEAETASLSLPGDTP